MSELIREKALISNNNIAGLQELRLTVRDVEKLLQFAVENNKVAAARYLLGFRGLGNVQSLTYRAIDKRQLQILPYLLQYPGIAIEPATVKRYVNDYDMFSILINARLDPNRPDAIFNYAAGERNIQALELALEKYSNINYLNAFMAAIRYQLDENAKLIFAHLDSAEQTEALKYAAENLRYSMVEYILENSEDLDIDVEYLIQRYIELGNGKMLRILLQYFEPSEDNILSAIESDDDLVLEAFFQAPQFNLNPYRDRALSVAKSQKNILIILNLLRQGLIQPNNPIINEILKSKKSLSNKELEILQYPQILKYALTRRDYDKYTMPLILPFLKGIETSDPKRTFLEYWGDLLDADPKSLKYLTLRKQLQNH